MYISGVKIENFRGIGKETIFKFNPGITVLVGENDSGKSTVIDAIRYVLGTTDQNWYKVEFSDYHNENTEDEIRISICFSDLSLKEKAAFMECLTYTKTGEKLYLNWTVKYMKNVKPNRTLVNLTCGKNGDVSAPSPEARELLRVTYLRPLRDAYAQIRAGRNSRLAQIMSSISGLNSRIDKANIYDQAVLEGVATTFPQTEDIIENGKVDGVSATDVQKILNLKHAWEFILDRDVIQSESNYHMLCHIAKLVNEGFFYAGGRIRGIPVLIGGFHRCLSKQWLSRKLTKLEVKIKNQ